MYAGDRMVTKSRVTLTFKELTFKWARLLKKQVPKQIVIVSHGKWYEGIKQKSETENNGRHLGIYLES